MMAKELEKELGSILEPKSFHEKVRHGIEGIPDITDEHNDRIYLRVTALASVEILKQLEKMNGQNTIRNG